MLPTAATQHYNSQRTLAEKALRSVRTDWQRIGAEFDAGWAVAGATIVATVQDAMRDAAQDGAAYVPAILEQTRQDAGAIQAANPDAFTEANRDGTLVADVLRTAIIQSKVAVREGADVYGALLRGRKFLDVAVPSLIADANRGAVQATLTTTPVTGYVRMLNTPSCRRCIPLAGKWFRWNEGFERHPQCDCRHIPASENRAGDFRTDPYELFHSMSEAEQNATFGKANAKAIRDGADMYKVLNVYQRGLPVAENASTRLTLAQVYTEAGSDRAAAVRILKREGYILGDQEVHQQRERFSEPSKRPVAPGSARAQVLEARSTGQRDPLDRATMTAAERRLFDAVYSLEFARRNGVVPRSIGVNSADDVSGSLGMPLTRERLELLERAVQRQVAEIGRAGTRSQVALVNALGLNDDTSGVVHERIFAQMQRDYLSATGSKARGMAMTLAEALRYL